MEGTFTHVLDMSIAAGWLIGVLILLRVVYNKLPKWVNCLLWAVVAIRLICPFTIASEASLIPRRLPTAQQIMDNRYSEPIDDMEESKAPINPEGMQTPERLPTEQSKLTIQKIAADIIWPAGIAAMCLYAAISYILLRRKVRISVFTENNVYITDKICSPFILGVLRPRIYLPSHLEQEVADYVIAHEQAHIRRWDHIWKPLGLIILCIHWFNPLVWIAYILFCSDIELACDEKVIKNKDIAYKKAYSAALLACSIPKRIVNVCSVAFGEVGVKQRIKRVLNYKKPLFWLIIIALVVSVAITVGFMLSPVSPKTGGDLDATEDQSFTTEPADEAQGHITEPSEDQNIHTEPSEDPVPSTEATEPVTADTILTMETDLNHDGVFEYLVVTEIPGQIQRMEIYDGDKLLYTEEGFFAHVGWNSLFLCHIDGKEYLLRYNPTMFQGNCHYSYELFDLAGDRVQIQESDSVEFDVNFKSDTHAGFDYKAIAKLVDHVNMYLIDSTCVLNTDLELIETFKLNGMLIDTISFMRDIETFEMDHHKTLEENLKVYMEVWN